MELKEKDQKINEFRTINFSYKRPLITSSSKNRV
jgi:hypothetical protein